MSSKAERAGVTWGRYLAPRRAPLAGPPSDEQATDDVVAMLDEQGFAPEVEDDGVALRRCPYYDLAEQRRNAMPSSSTSGANPWSSSIATTSFVACSSLGLASGARRGAR